MRAAELANAEGYPGATGGAAAVAAGVGAGMAEGCYWELIRLAERSGGDLGMSN
jgi:hypothetical protein